MKERLTNQADFLKKEVSAIKEERDSFKIKAKNLQK